MPLRAARANISSGSNEPSICKWSSTLGSWRKKMINRKVPEGDWRKKMISCNLEAKNSENKMFSSSKIGLVSSR